MDREFLETLSDALDRGLEVVLVTLVETRGSVPREAGAKMLVFPDGTIHGTVGGGALEKRALEEARDLRAHGGTRLLRLNLKEDVGMACGGAAVLFFEVLRRAGRLVLFGGGHIGRALHTLAPLLGLRPVVVDERPAFCNASRFPGTEIHPVPPEEAVQALGLGRDDYLVIATHGHARDLESLRAVVHLPVAYIGMIGSRKKVAETFTLLREEGVPEEALARVHAPMGLNLGGRTPGEIAVAVAAEIIAERSARGIHELGWT